jgi:hypothetical protein
VNSLLAFFFAISGVAVSPSTIWTNLTNMSASGSALTKTSPGAYDGQAYTGTTYPGNVTFTLSVTSGSSVIAGLSDSVNGTYTGIKYAMGTDDGLHYRVYESGVGSAGASISISSSDVIKFTRVGTLVQCDIIKAGTPTTLKVYSTPSVGSIFPVVVAYEQTLVVSSAGVF